MPKNVMKQLKKIKGQISIDISVSLTKGVEINQT